MTDFTQTNYPIGQKIERIRRIIGMKQETLARELGVSPQAVSKMEQSENIDDEKLGLVAKALGVTVEAIKNFNQDAVIQNIFNEQCNDFKFNCTFNPIEKIVELYERMLVIEREKNDLLQGMLKNFKT